MKIFPIKSFLAAEVIMHQILAYSQNMNDAAQEAVVDATMLTGYADLFESLSQEMLNDVEMPVTQSAISRLHGEFRDEDTRLTLKELNARVHEVQSRLFDEFDTHGKFFYIPFPRAKRWEDPEPFGSVVSAKFSKVAEDIEEAVKCYACARYTACVFHLMRVMEHGLQRLGKKLGVPDVDTTVWQKILDQVNSAIRNLPPKSPRTRKIAQIAAHLYNVKLAWRNEVMHPKSTYTEEESEILLKQVGTFMEDLAGVI